MADRQISAFTLGSPSTGTEFPGTKDGTTYKFSLFDLGVLIKADHSMGHNSSGDFTTSGNAYVSGRLFVSGDTVLGRGYDTTTILGGLKESGNAEISGRLTVSGDVRISGNATFASNIQESGNLTVAGYTYLQGPMTGLQTLNISGDTNLAGAVYLGTSLNTGVFVRNNLVVSGKETILDYLEVKKGLVCSGDITGMGNLDVRGALSTQSSLTVATGGLGDYLAINGTLIVSSTGVFKNKVFIEQNLTVTGQFGVSGNSVIGDASSDTLIVNATPSFRTHTNFESSVGVSGVFNFGGNLNANNDVVVGGNVRIANNLTVSGDTILGSSAGNLARARGAMVIGTTATVSGNSDLQGDVTVGGVLRDIQNSKMVRFRILAVVTTTPPTSSSNIVTMTFASPPSVSVGELIYVSGITASSYDGSYYVDSVASNTLTYHGSGSLPGTAPSNMTLGTAIPTGGRYGVSEAIYHSAGKVTVKFNPAFPSTNYIPQAITTRHTNTFATTINVSEDTNAQVNDRVKMVISNGNSINNLANPPAVFFKADYIPYYV